MTDDDRSERDREEDDPPAPTPDTDPRHLDPAGDLADLFESGDLGATVDDDGDREELKEWLARAEAGEFGADPGVEATARIVRALLNDAAEREDPAE